MLVILHPDMGRVGDNMGGHVGGGRIESGDFVIIN
jgi:hypothetical protein